MKIDEKCLLCMIRQAMQVAAMTGCTHREALYQKMFAELSHLNMQKTTPEIMGELYLLIKDHVGREDPYAEVRKHYNSLLMKESDQWEERILSSPSPLEAAVRFAILGNMIDFSALDSVPEDDLMDRLNHAPELELKVNDCPSLARKLAKAETILYIGDNCGEVCMDRLLIRQMKRCNPAARVVYVVRGAPVVNDVIQADADMARMEREATVISNGDTSQGHVLDRVSGECEELYRQADLIISKGQGNYECLSEAPRPGIFYLLMTKCPQIAGALGVPVGSAVCLESKV